MNYTITNEIRRIAGRIRFIMRFKNYSRLKHIVQIARLNGC